MTNAKEKEHTHLVKISQLSQLSGVPSPTIKYYMAEGLLPEPALKTSRNMAYYDPRLAARIRAIKDLQQNHFFPLKVISELLQPIPSAELREDLDENTRAKLGLLESGIREGQEEALPAPLDKMTRAGILEQLDVSEDDLQELERLGLAEPLGKDSAEHRYDGPDLQLLQVISEARGHGLGDIFPMDILEPYSQAIGRLVRLELEMLSHRVVEAKLPPNLTPMEVARLATVLSARMVTAIRSKLVLNQLGNLPGLQIETSDSDKTKKT